MTQVQTEILPEFQQRPDSRKSDIVLRGLELDSERLSLNLDQPPLSVELGSLERCMRRDAEALGQAKKGQRATMQLIDQLHGIDAIVDKYQADKTSLIQILLDVQAQLHWLPKSGVMWVSERLGIPLAQIYDIATFYKAFSLVPRGRHIVQVCLGTTCYVQGGPRLLGEVEEVLGVKLDVTKVLPKSKPKTDEPYLGNCYSYFRNANQERKEVVKTAKAANTTSEGITKAIHEILGERTAPPEGSAAVKEAILAVLARAADEPDFLRSLADNPHETLREYYALTWEERAALASGDIQKIESWVGKLDKRLATWLWCRLCQEKW